ncbi:hypothetical protein D3C87_895780 [compost metagenome]
MQPGEQAVELQQQGIEGAGEQHEVDQQGDQHEGADARLADEGEAAQEVVCAADRIFDHVRGLAHLRSINEGVGCQHITNKPPIW